MSSERRTRSSRANGAKSNGPKTAEGKARSSQNSVVHGLMANAIVLNDESRETFNALHAELVTELSPATPFESNLVCIMVAARWRSVRIWGMENSGLQTAMDKLPQAGAGDPCARASSAIHGIAAGPNKPSEGLLRRYESHSTRQFNQAFHLLVRYRQLCGTIFAPRPAAQPDQAPPPPPAPPPATPAAPTADAAPNPPATVTLDAPPSPSPAPKACRTRRDRRKNRATRRRQATEMQKQSQPNPKNGHTLLPNKSSQI